MEIKSHREDKSETLYRLEFNRVGERGCRYAFDCDKDGNPVKPEALKDIEFLRAGKDYDGTALINKGVQQHEHFWTEYAVGVCCCGREVELSGFTNACECGIDYNSSGQKLAPREQWGCETGESLTDILNIK